MDGETKLYFDALVALSLGNTAAIAQLAGALAEKGLLTPSDVQRFAGAFTAPIDGLTEDAPNVGYFRQLRTVVQQFLAPIAERIEQIAQDHHPEDSS